MVAALRIYCCQAAVDSTTARHRPLHKPTVWGDFFLRFRPCTPTQHLSMEKKTEAKKEVVRKMIHECSGLAALPPKLELVDALQRLGVDYHYVEEIDDLLRGIRDAGGEGCDLHTTALRFYLLRKQGHRVSPDVFLKFKDAQGHLACNDTPSLLRMYDAAHLRVHGEETLDGAIVSTRKHLQSVAGGGGQPAGTPPVLLDQVRYSLQTPLFRRPRRLEARLYIEAYEKMSTRNDAVLELAKLDFSLLQSLYCQELRTLTQWWKELGLQDHLGFARDRMVEVHFWMLGVIFEPQHSYGRIMLTKFSTLVSIFDDIYDTHGTLEECKLLTIAVERWDEQAAEQLPGYMKYFYGKVLATINDIEQHLKLQGCMHAHYVKKLMIDMTRCYYKEAEWRHGGGAPPATVEEHLRFSLPSIGASCMHVPCVAFASMQEATGDVIEWGMAYPKIILASCTIGRIINDIASHQRERDQCAGQHVTSTVEACMEENGYVDKEDAYRKLREIMEQSWMDIVEECFDPPPPATAALMEVVVNATRMVEFWYRAEDAYTRPDAVLKGTLESTYVDSIYQEKINLVD